MFKNVNKAMVKDFGKKFGHGALLFTGGVIACVAEELLCRNTALGLIGLFSGGSKTEKPEAVNEEEPDEEEDESEDEEE